MLCDRCNWSCCKITMERSGEFVLWILPQFISVSAERNVMYLKLEGETNACFTYYPSRKCFIKYINILFKKIYLKIAPPFVLHFNARSLQNNIPPFKSVFIIVNGKLKEGRGEQFLPLLSLGILILENAIWGEIKIKSWAQSKMSGAGTCGTWAHQEQSVSLHKHLLCPWGAGAWDFIWNPPDQI